MLVSALTIRLHPEPLICFFNFTLLQTQLIQYLQHQIIYLFFLFFEMGLLSVDLAALNLSLQTRLARNAQRSAYLSLPSAGIKAIYHHWLAFSFLLTLLDLELARLPGLVYSSLALTYRVLEFYCGFSGFLAQFFMWHKSLLLVQTNT